MPKKLKPKYIKVKPEKKSQADLMIEQKARESILKQNKLRETFLARLYSGFELQEIQNQLKGKIEMQWYGMPYPKKLLEIEHDMKLHAYKRQISEEKYLQQALIKEGRSMEDIQEIMKGKFKKTEDLLKEKEK